MAKYINPYTDFGFKKLFGEDANKDLLIDFLNQLLPQKHTISQVTFKNPEKLGVISTERKAIFDIHCTTREGHQFIVEMQKAKLKFFKDRSIFYTTFPIREQAEKGDWNFELKPVYCVAILDFEFEKRSSRYLSRVYLKSHDNCLCEQQLPCDNTYCEIFYDKLCYIFIEMPRFNKPEAELHTHFEKWLYFLKNLESFESIPDILKEPVFEKGFHIAEIAGYTPKELREYEESLKVYRDLKGVVDTSFEEGKQEGRIEGRIEGREEGEKIGMEKRDREIVLNMHKNNMAIDVIAHITGLDQEKVRKIIETSL